MGLLLRAAHVGAELVGQAGEARQVDRDARVLHLREEGHQRTLDLGEQLEHALLGEARTQVRREVADRHRLGREGRPG